MVEAFDGGQPQRIESPAPQAVYDAAYSGSSATGSDALRASPPQAEPSHLDFGTDDTLYGNPDGPAKPSERASSGDAGVPETRNQNYAQDDVKERPPRPLTDEEFRARLLPILMQARIDMAHIRAHGAPRPDWRRYYPGSRLVE